MITGYREFTNAWFVKSVFPLTALNVG